MILLCLQTLQKKNDVVNYSDISYQYIPSDICFWFHIFLKKKKKSKYWSFEGIVLHLAVSLCQLNTRNDKHIIWELIVFFQFNKVILVKNSKKDML